MKTKQIIMLFVALFVSFITFACSGEKKSENTEASCTAVESVSADEDIATETLAVTKEESTPVSPSSSSSSPSSSSTNSSDWDRVLDKYESYTDNYISLLKKAQAGDMSAMTEYIDVMEDAQDLADELEDAQGDFTRAQLSRYMRILNKMTNAAMSM